MGQKGFFDVERRLEAISALGDPLETIKKIVPWLQRSAWSPARHQNGPRSGAHLGTSPALVRSAKAESPKPAIVRGAFERITAELVTGGLALPEKSSMNEHWNLRDERRSAPPLISVVIDTYNHE